MQPDQPPPAPGPGKFRVFIAYDFEIGGTLPDDLAGVSSKPPQGFDVEWPGSTEGASQGAIWTDVVRGGISRCDRLLAFVDLPNANVGFEVGFGLGLGKMVALARVKPTRHAWLGLPPLHGFLCPALGGLSQIRKQVGSTAEGDWLRIGSHPTGGQGVLFLCPRQTGEVYREQVPQDWGWRTLPDDRWDLRALPGLLEGVGLIVWVIAPHNEGAAGRDGPENAALSVVAGYAESRPELRLRVLQARNARAVVDVVASRSEFANPSDFAERLAAIRAEWEAEASSPVALREPPERPAFEPLPSDDWLDVPARFLGRNLQLADAAEAVEGLLHRARTGQAPPSGGRAVKLIWVHGFGGMGKSWFLHRVRLRAGDAARAVIVDWDSAVWRLPLTGEPRTAVDLFETIAYRLAQACGAPASDPYWAARARVRAQADRHRKLLGQFEGQLLSAATPERVGSALLGLLRQEGIWADDPARRASNLERLRGDPARYRGLFASWCRATDRDADDAAVEPDRVLADGLREALRGVARLTPLLLLLDTCEVLPADLDRWLRAVLVPLCRDETPVLVLVGSRLEPDVAIPAGSREGWQSEVPGVRFRPVPFGELVRFTVEEIEKALTKLKSDPAAAAVDALAERLHRLSRGVPLAVRALLDDLQTHGRDGALLAAPDDDEEEPLDEREAVRKVVSTVARRLLYHLDQDRRPEREDDLRDIAALAILQRADEAILRNLWPGRPVRRRLRDLGARYALLSGGDLHATVRGYLRRFWRDEEERPRVFDEVLDAVERAVASLPSPAPGEVGEAIARRTLAVNLLAWRFGDAALPELARALAVSLAHEQGADDLASLLGELPHHGETLAESRKLWRVAGVDLADLGPIAAWLRAQRQASSPWTDEESACLNLLEGIAASPSFKAPAQAVAALMRLKAALIHFESELLPRRSQVGEAIFSIAMAIDPYVSQDDRFLAEAEDAYLQAARLGANEATSYNNLGNLYQVHLGRYEDAKRSYLRAIELDPTDANTHNGLGGLYQAHLERYEDAERSYLHAIKLDPRDPNAISNLGELYGFCMGRPGDAEREYRRAIKVAPKFQRGYSGLAWLRLRYGGDTREAREWARKAVRVEPGDSEAILAAIAVETWDRGWAEARAMMPSWLAGSPAGYPSQYRVFLVPLFRKIREQDGLADLAGMLWAVADRVDWRPLAEAVTALADGRGREGCLGDEARRVFDELTAE